MRLSREFLIAVKLAGRPQWRIAREAGVSPITLSRIVTGYTRIDRNDARVCAVGRVLGIEPDVCFEPECSTEAAAVA